MRIVLVVAAAALGAMLLTGPTALVAGTTGTASALPSTYSPPTGAGVMGYMESYVMTHPYRLGSATTPTMTAARDDLVTELQGMGLHVVRHNYNSPSGQNILAFLNGTSKSNEWIVLSAHYDTVETTVYGAWDDGAGVAQLLELARSYSTRTFNRTIVFAFFDDEEQGLFGSEKFVNDPAYKSKLYANLNFDPPGLNWPCADATGPLPVKFSFNAAKVVSDPVYKKIYDGVIEGMNLVGVPANARDLAPALPIASIFGAGLAGTSDHQSFEDENIPNAFLGSLPTTKVGNTRALNYPLHTPADDLATMIARCGSESTLEAAFDVQLAIVNHAVTTKLDA